MKLEDIISGVFGQKLPTYLRKDGSDKLNEEEFVYILVKRVDLSNPSLYIFFMIK